MQATEVTESFSLNSVVPFFQPIMDLNNNAVWSYECLARLITLDECTHLPSEFLFLLERQQSLAQLTHTIFNRSANYFKDINMAWNINISQSDMTDLDMHGFLYSRLCDYPNPSRVSFEITAQNALGEKQYFAQFVKMCNSLGVNIVIDHFDQTVSNLNEILDLPISAVKVSGKIFEQVTTESEIASFATQLMSLSALNKITVIAEHIEHKTTLDVAKESGVKYAQGFYFSQPKAIAN
jgi:EAL domain-containing protein (putative c-di-GMP-specific phosphodiesterase class I)